MVSSELRDLCVDLRYSFTILARYPTVGPRTFSKIFEVPKVSWRPTPYMAPHSPRGLVEGGQRAPPMPEQCPAPEDGRLQRWYDSRFVLLTWPGLEVSEETKAPTSQQYEL